MYRTLVAFLLLASLSLVSLTSASSDPCYFPQIQGFWRGSPSQVKACFDSIPFDESVHNNTLFILDVIMDLYSFGDIVQEGLPPFNLAVNWPQKLASIRSSEYSSDYAFQTAVAQLVNSLQDAHNAYAFPEGYRAFTTSRPFALSSRLVSGSQAIFAEPTDFPSSFYQQFFQTSTNLNDYYGRRIVEIDQVPVMTWLSDFAASRGLFADAGVRLNFLFTENSPFISQRGSFMPLPADTFNLTFEGDSEPTEFYTFSFTNYLINSTEDLISLNHFSSVKRDHFSRSNPFYEEAKRLSRLLEDEIQEVQAEKARRGEKTTDKLSRAVESLEDLKLSLQPRMGTRDLRHQSALLMIEDQKILKAQRSLMSLKLRRFAESEPKYTRTMYSDASSLSNLQQREATSISHTSFQVDTQNANVIVGNPSNLQRHSSAPGVAYWTYKDVTVMKLSSFSVFGPSIDAFMRKFVEISQRGAKSGLGGDLIIDVTGNGGGLIALQYFALSFLVRDWNSAGFVGSDILYSPYDWRQSNYTDDLFQFELANGVAQFEYINTSSRLPYPADTVYTPPVERGNSNYTQKFLWRLATSSFFAASRNSRVFDRILIITDGTCGSACSSFISTLRFSNKTKVLSYGGIWGQSMDTSSFAGGNVYEWEEWLFYLREEFIDFPWMVDFITTSFATFNFRELFMTGDDVPRQFISMPADWRIPFWPIDLWFATASEENQFLATLYESALPLLRQIPAGLLGENPSGGNMLAINLSSVILLLIAAIIVQLAL